VPDGFEVSDESSFKIAEVAAALIVIVVLLFIAVQLIPALTSVLYDLLAPVLLLWFTVVVLRTVIRAMLS
jgi:hypothetical protein